MKTFRLRLGAAICCHFVKLANIFPQLWNLYLIAAIQRAWRSTFDNKMIANPSPNPATLIF
ncbi:MAG: hypothetical protein A3I66_05630 [Burkholderiales bacterium RIFCSPLOWO2_02_FULL_57_36]|nr:MAG: hypothetical protein A3I66_05630 [Burkholderiales bacterium RIFCSPLOWO2_02_FULL_57_36]